ncbi:hypothetical protein GH714_002910 [Hevea brasiliensis]|uniref:MaoC-like domain-containing protein n=1 Tax=Hevea brasiliensis TaxID=3981 RepID=A0A6A6N826_HEVBR|nr:hypothetical protein GH714_002910 [Hevea brasiliensis]
MMFIKSLLSRTVPYARCFSWTAPSVLQTGDSLRQTRVFSNEDVIEYSKVSHDSNPLHFDAESARNAGFEDRVVHGMLVAALFPRIIASHFVSPSSIHDIQYYGDHIFTTVTAAAVVVDEWIANTMHIHKRELSELLIAVDTEWCMPTPLTLNGACLPNQMDTNKLPSFNHVGKRCLIFQLYHADDIPPSLIQFLGNKKFKFVGKRVWNDACKLFEDYELLVAHTKDVGY